MKRPDTVNDDEQFSRSLAHSSEAPTADGNPDPSADAALSPPLRQRLQRALDYLRRLRQLLPATDPLTIPYSKPEPATVVLSADTTLQEGADVGQVGRFRILRTLGQGGGGIVFLAFDPELRRKVALKVPQLEALVSPELRQRFLREARAAAGLNHPNLVPVHEAGEADGLCFIVSAYCPGSNLAEWLSRQMEPAPVRLAAELVVVLADAVRYIHERGIYHRDIKPSNILLDSDAGHSGELGFTPRLTDFGLAKVRDGQTDATRSGAMLGTAPYMAPEQIEGRQDDIGPRTDVYGLGAVLYEVLTRHPPFRGLTDADTMRQVLANEPPAPRRLRRDVPGDLATICLKCLEKEPARRYAAAAELADDLRRFLAHEPIQARPPGRIERLGKWARRRPAAAVLVAAGILTCLGLLAGGLWHEGSLRGHDRKLAAAARREQQQKERLEQQCLEIRDKEEQVRQARAARYAGDMRRAWNAWQSGQTEEMAALLEAHRPRVAGSDSRGFEWYYLHALSRGKRSCLRATITVYCLAFSPDGRTCATGHEDGVIRLWDTESGKVRTELRVEEPASVFSLAFSSDGRFLVGGYGSPNENRGMPRLWDLSSGQVVWQLPGGCGNLSAVAFSPDGGTLAFASHRRSANGSRVRLWDLAARKQQAEVPLLPEGERVVHSLAFAADGKTLALGCQDGSIRLCDAADGAIRATRLGHAQKVSALVFAGNDVLVSAAADATLRLWDRKEKDCRHLLRQARGVCGLAASADGRTLTSLDGDGLIRGWDVNTGQERFRFRCPLHGCRALALTRDGKRAAVGSVKGMLCFCDVPRTAETLSWLGHHVWIRSCEAWAVAFSPDGKVLASAGDDLSVQQWDPATGRSLSALYGHSALVSCVAFSPDGRWLASGSFDKLAPVKLWDAATRREVAALHGHTAPVDCLAFSPDSRLLATAGRDGTVQLWDVAARTEVETLRGHNVHALAFSPDGRTLALAGPDQTVFLWDVARREVRWTLPPHPWGHVAVAFSPDGQTLATSEARGVVKFWDAATGDLRRELKSHDDEIHCLAFSPDGKTLATASFDRTVKLWQVSTGEELLKLPEHAERVRWVTFSPDGKMLATAGHDGVLTIYRAAAGDEQSPDAP
ncbi:MAG TPA: protein kinase [Gemmataceae bacterium]|jgi:WD40 repeat protein